MFLTKWRLQSQRSRIHLSSLLGSAVVHDSHCGGRCHAARTHGDSIWINDRFVWLALAAAADFTEVCWCCQSAGTCTHCRYSVCSGDNEGLLPHTHAASLQLCKCEKHVQPLACEFGKASEKTCQKSSLSCKLNQITEPERLFVGALMTDSLRLSISHTLALTNTQGAFEPNTKHRNESKKCITVTHLSKWFPGNKHKKK